MRDGTRKMGDQMGSLTENFSTFEGYRATSVVLFNSIVLLAMLVCTPQRIDYPAFLLEKKRGRRRQEIKFFCYSLYRIILTPFGRPSKFGCPAGGAKYAPPPFGVNQVSPGFSRDLTEYWQRRWKPCRNLEVLKSFSF